MKKIISLILAVVLMCSFAVITNASDDITVYLDGVEIQFDVKPQIIGGRTMVPIRAIFEKMGASVEWNSATATATAKRGTTTVVMAVGDTNMCVNNVCSAMDAAPAVINGRTLAPARYVAEAFGGTVAWNPQTRRVDITSSKPVTLYALDGRTISVNSDEVQAYINVGWYYTPVVQLYAPDGRTVVVAISEKDSYINVGWYDTAEKAAAANKPVESSSSSSSTGSSYQSNNTHGGAVYRTPSGKKYHFDPNCGGKNSRQTTLSAAKSAGLTPCSKCAY